MAVLTGAMVGGALLTARGGDALCAKVFEQLDCSFILWLWKTIP